MSDDSDAFVFPQPGCKAPTLQHKHWADVEEDDGLLMGSDSRAAGATEGTDGVHCAAEGAVSYGDSPKATVAAGLDEAGMAAVPEAAAEPEFFEAVLESSPKKAASTKAAAIGHAAPKPRPNEADDVKHTDVLLGPHEQLLLAAGVDPKRRHLHQGSGVTVSGNAFKFTGVKKQGNRRCVKVRHECREEAVAAAHGCFSTPPRKLRAGDTAASLAVEAIVETGCRLQWAPNNVPLLQLLVSLDVNVDVDAGLYTVDNAVYV
jgi:hypothetical protein